MPNGVKRSPEETEEIQQKMIAHLAGGIGRTFYGACQACGVGVSEAYEWRKEIESFDEAVKAARNIGYENMKDLAEKGVVSLLQKEDAKTVRWFMETKGRDRDYIKRNELTGAGGSPLNPLTEPKERPTEEEAFAAFSEMARRPT